MDVHYTSLETDDETNFLVYEMVDLTKEKGRPGGLRFLGCVVSIAAGVVGGPLLGLPYCFHLVGVTAATGMLLFAAVLTGYSGQLLSRTFKELYPTLHASDEFAASPYLGMASAAGGRWLARFAGVVIFVQSLLFLSFGFIVVGSNLQSLCPAIPETWWILIFSTVLVIPLMVRPNPRDWWWTQLVALGTSTLSCIAIVALSIGSMHDPNVGYSSDANRSATGFTYQHFSEAVGAILLAFSGHYVFPTLQIDMKEPDRLPSAIKVSYGIILFLFLFVGIFGQLGYEASVQHYFRGTASVNFTGTPPNLLPKLGGNVLLSLPNGIFRDVAIVFMTAHILFVMVQFSSPVSIFLDHAFAHVRCCWWIGIRNIEDTREHRLCDQRKFVMRVLQVGVVVIVAILAREHLFCFGSLIGASTASFTAFIFPAMFAFQLLTRATTAERMLWIFVGVVGLVAGVAATVAAVAAC